MYQYSFNNPINLLDSEGSWPKWAKKIAVAVAIVTVVVLTAVVVTSTAGVGTVPAVIACGAVSSRVKNGNWNDSKEAALNGMGNGALAGTIGGTVSGTVSSSVKVYNAASSWSAGGTYSSGYNSMVNHYERQVLNKGFSDGNNVINYTNDALNFANRNSEVLQFINPSRGTMTSAFRSPYMDGVQGGWFTSDGKILTFWYK